MNAIQVIAGLEANIRVFQALVQLHYYAAMHRYAHRTGNPLLQGQVAELLADAEVTHWNRCGEAAVAWLGSTPFSAGPAGHLPLAAN